MKKFLILLMMLLPLQMYAGTTSVDAQAEKVVDVKKMSIVLIPSN